MLRRMGDGSRPPEVQAEQGIPPPISDLMFF